MMASKNVMASARRRLTALSFAAAALAIPAGAGAAELFKEVSNAFGTQPCSGGEQGCFTNYTRLTDLDGDGDLDIVFPNAEGYFSKGSAEPLVIYLNDGSGAFSNQSAAIVGNFTGYVRQVAVGDVNGDGEADFYAPSAWGDADAFFVNQGSGVFVDEAAARMPGVKSRAGAARFGDVDADGDLDLFVGDGWATSAAGPAHLYLNDGAGVFSDATSQLPTSQQGDGPIDFDLLDADGDLDLDLLIDMHTGTSSLWINDGAGQFEDGAGRIPGQGALKYGPAVCDVDGDGDIDMWFDNAGPNYTEQLLINDGAGYFTDETSQRVTGNPGSDDNGVACIDADGDGDLDAAVMSLSGNERVLFNDGTGKFTHLAGVFSSASDATLWFDFGDVDGDGRLDCVTGQGESGSWLNRLYLGTPAAPVDALPPRLRAVESIAGPVAASATPAVRFAVSDNAVTDEGPRLSRAYVRVTTGDSSIEVDAKFMGGDLFRAVLPAHAAGTTVSYAACATDRRGNDACALAKSYDTEPGAATTTTTTGAGGGAGGADPTSTTTTAAAGGAGDVDGAGGGGGDWFQPEDGGGCGCALPGGATGEGVGSTAVLVAALVAAQRRLRRRR